MYIFQMQKATQLTLAAKSLIYSKYFNVQYRNLKTITDFKLLITFCCELWEALENTMKTPY